MKLDISLPSRPRFIHALAAINLLALVLIFPILGIASSQETGIKVELHESTWRYKQIDNPIVVTLGAGHNSPMWVNKNRIAHQDLEKEINKLRAQEEGSTITTVVIRSDVSVLSGLEKQIINRILAMGLHCGILGKAPANKPKSQ